MAEILEQLRSSLDRANQLIQTLESTPTDSPRRATGLGTENRVRELEGRLEALEQDHEELASRLVEAEHQASKLMSLYVATFQLHATLDPVEVQRTIAEIARDLLGAERFVLLLKDEDRGGCEIALSQGADDDPSGLYKDGYYWGGDPSVNAALQDGVLRLSERQAEAKSIAAVPLRVDNSIVGALVILKLLEHRVTPLSEDRDMLDLLAAHAASALFAARVCSNADRKLRTLESLVGLLRGDRQ